MPEPNDTPLALATERKASGDQAIALTTERLVLRQLDSADAPFIRRLLNEPGFLRFIGDRGVRSDAAARDYIARVAQGSYERFGFGLLLVERLPERVPVGMCGVMRKPWLDAPDLAYAFLAEAGGRGFATEAARAVLEHARATCHVGRVLAVVTPDNAASIRVLEKLDFTALGTVADPDSDTVLRLYTSPMGGRHDA